MSDGPRLEVRGICKAFGSVSAVNSVTFDLSSGDVLGIVGPGGAGKTTLIDCLCGQVRKSAGVVRYGGREITRFGVRDLVGAGIVRTFQAPHRPPRIAPLERLMAVLAAPRADCPAELRQARAEELLDHVGFEGAVHAIDGPLSGIDLRRLELARCLALRPEVLVTDELLGGLPPDEAAGLAARLDRLRGRVTLIVAEARLLDWLRGADRVVALRLGAKVADGTPGEVCRAVPDLV